MKNLLKNNWLRRSFATLLVAASLLALGVAWLNWEGVRMKRDVIALMKAEGRPLSLMQMVREMPADEQNFAMLPIIVRAREETWANPHVWVWPQPEHAGSLLLEMGGRFSGARAHFPKPGGGMATGEFRAGNLDLPSWLELYGISGTPEECLARYDALYADVISQLRQGLERPWTVSPSLEHAARNDGNSGYLFRPLDSVAAGMARRAEMATRCGRSDVVAESLKIMVRLTELAESESRHHSGGFGVQATLINRLASAIRGTLPTGVLDELQLVDLSRALDRVDLFESHLHSLDVENLTTFSMFEDPRFKRSYLYPFRNRQPRPIPEWASKVRAEAVDTIPSLIPRGGWDAHAAIHVRQGVQLRSLLEQTRSLAEWLDVLQQEDAAPQRSFMGREIDQKLGDFRTAAHIGRIPFEQKMRHAKVAIELERHRLLHGEYPDDLEELNTDQVIDSLTGEPFRYGLTDSGFLLYSIGADGRDNDGEQTDWQGPDLVW